MNNAAIANIHFRLEIHISAIRECVPCHLHYTWRIINKTSVVLGVCPRCITLLTAVPLFNRLWHTRSFTACVCVCVQVRWGSSACGHFLPLDPLIDLFFPEPPFLLLDELEFLLELLSANDSNKLIDKNR